MAFATIGIVENSSDAFCGPVPRLTVVEANPSEMVKVESYRVADKR